MSQMGQPKAHASSHPYLAGNFAPVTKTSTPTPVSFSGKIPNELRGGMYVRNGGNPILNSDLGREAHWFDGDGMLTGVWFNKSKTNPGETTPHFVNQFILTDICIASFENEKLRTPILPSIATLVDPLARLVVIIWSILRCAFLVLLSHFPGSQQAIKRISVANTHILYHDGRALATCESGPPIRVQLPGLETVGWYNGNSAEGEVENGENQESGFGGTGVNSWMREWTTGHPKVDPTTGEMVLFHCNFLPPFVHYSVVPKEKNGSNSKVAKEKILNAAVPGCTGGKMMHDFGVSKHHTVILDLPLSLSPFNLLKNNPIVSYDPSKPARFGIFPRRHPSAIRWFETDGCCIFHTANTWDEIDSNGNHTAVNMLACRLTSASLVFSAGNIAPPPHPSPQNVASLKSQRISFFAPYGEETKDPEIEITEEQTPLILPEPFNIPSPPILEGDEEQCRLYYYRFDLTSTNTNSITHQYAFSTIPFEFPTVNPDYEMSFARYIYGCSTSNASFGAALGKATKIDIILKMDVRNLLALSKSRPPEPISGTVDSRSIAQVLASTDPNDSIKAFALPPHHYAQEARFVPRENPTSEDDGFLLFYVFDESQLDESGACPDDAKSELWVVDATDMRTVVCKVLLEVRVPYGLHGSWFSEEMIREQREVAECRKMPIKQDLSKGTWESFGASG